MSSVEQTLCINNRVYKVRPVINVTDAVTVKFKLKLSQLIDVVSSKIALLDLVVGISEIIE